MMDLLILMGFVTSPAWATPAICSAPIPDDVRQAVRIAELKKKAGCP